MDAIDMMLEQSRYARVREKMANLYVKAVDIARRAHKGQTRWNGSDYFENHCVPVSEMLDDYTKVIIAVLHDVKEDCDPTYWDEIVAAMPDFIVAPLALLCHDKAESYAVYIQRVALHPDAIHVKLADLTHNLSDLKSDSAASKQRRDKYLLAKLYLMEKLAQWRTA